MKRQIDEHLLKWKEEKGRKVLLLRGARQVGKTYSVRKLGKTFKNFLEVNFEEQPEVHSFFQQTLNPKEITEKLSIYFETSIQPGKTLIFFDEIQSCPNALRSLRYFYEKFPQLHVIAAGSLLEFALEAIPSFGVGRISPLFMYPMNFSEFLHADDGKRLNALIDDSGWNKPLDPVFHKRILEKLKIFQLLGGMPEVVKTYIETRDFIRSQRVLDNLITVMTDDFTKYKKRMPLIRLQEVFQSVIYQVGHKFKYSHAGQGKIDTYKNALDLLLKAGLAFKINHSSAQGVPLGAQINPKRFKVVFFDCGIYQRMLGLEISEYLASDFKTIINKGPFTELYVGLELIAAQPAHLRPQLFYWQRESKSSNAEVDYVISNGEKVIPIEVKSGTTGQMQSLHLFLKERKLDLGIRISHENFTAYDSIRTVPLYAVKNLLKNKPHNAEQGS